MSVSQLFSLWLVRNRGIEIMHPRMILWKQGDVIGMKPSQKPRTIVNPFLSTSRVQTTRADERTDFLLTVHPQNAQTASISFCHKSCELFPD